MSTVENWRRFVGERLTAAAEEISAVFEQTVIEYEKEIERQRRMLDIIWKPNVKLHRIDQRVCKAEEGLTDQQLSNQEMISSLDQEEPETPHIKEEQEEVFSSPEGEQFVPKQEEDAVTPDSACQVSPFSRSSHILKKHIKEEQEEKPEPPHIKEEQEEVFSSPEGEQFIPKQEEVEVPPDAACQFSSPLMDGGDSQSEEDLPEPTVTTPPVSKSQPYTCKVCGESYSYKSLLVKHMRSHKSKKTFSCSVCGKGFSHQGHLTSHERSHTTEKEYSCSRREKRFSEEREMEVHMRTHTGEKPYSCSICGKSFSFHTGFIIHMRTHSGEKPYSNSTCGKIFSQSFTVKAHMRTHTDEKPYSCSICGKSFSQRTYMTVHMRTHTGEKPYSCSICGNSFSFLESCKIHMRTHTGEKPYSCSICGESFSWQKSLKQHVTNHTIN